MMTVGMQTNSSKDRSKPPFSAREKMAHMEISKVQHIHDKYARVTVTLVQQFENEAELNRKWLYDAKEVRFFKTFWLSALAQKNNL